MPHRARPFAMVAAAVLVLAAGCGSDGGAGGDPAAAGFPMTVRNCGREVHIDRPPRHVFAERDTSTALAAAGAADRIVARSGEGDVPLGRYQSALASVPQVGKGNGDPPSPEVVLGKGTDLVVAGHVQLQDVQALDAVGVPVLVPEWFCSQVFGGTASVGFDATYRTLRTFGQVFGTARAAEASIADLRRRVAAVHQRFAAAAGRGAANVYVSSSQLQVYGRPSVNNTVLETLALRNVFADSTKRVSEVSSDTIVGRNPDVVVLSYGTAYGIGNAAAAESLFAGKPGLDRLAAVRERRLIALNYGYLTGGPLTVDGLEMLADQLASARQKGNP